MNTNNFKFLTKGLFIIVNGKNLTNAEANQLLLKNKEQRIDGFIKNAGQMK